MTGQQWQAGDLLEATYQDPVTRRRGIVTTPGQLVPEPLYVEFADGSTSTLTEVLANAKVRPLVVIDPEDPEQVEALVAAYEAVIGESLYTTTRRQMRDALRSLIAPAKPEEPKGVGAVVEDADGDLWARNAGGHWLNLNGGTARILWRDLAGVRVLSEGVPS